MLEDILGLGKILPMNKLLDVVSNGIGRFTKAHYDKQDIDTEAYKIEKLAAAQALANQITNNSQKEQLTETQKSNLSLEERTQSRVSFQEQKKQINLEKVIAVAAEELKNEQTVTDEALDEDWITRFFKNAADISDEEMQSLWGKILAGEIKQPKTYSLRTLELVKNLTKEEAQTFEKVAHFAAIHGEDSYLFLTNARTNTRTFGEIYDITFSDILLLSGIGLIQQQEIKLYFGLNQKNITPIFNFGDKTLMLDIKANTPRFGIDNLVFTKAGHELLTLIHSKEVPFEYLKAFAESIKNETIDVKLVTLVENPQDKTKEIWTPLHTF
jgi:uncharacterized repeat protein (TIGR03899 family)